MKPRIILHRHHNRHGHVLWSAEVILPKRYLRAPWTFDLAAVYAFVKAEMA